MAEALARFPAAPVVPLRPAPKAAPLALGPPAPSELRHLQGLSVTLHHFQGPSVLRHHFQELSVPLHLQGPSAAPLLHGRAHRPEPRQERAERAAEEAGSTHHH